MTSIAWDGKTLAADGRTTWDGVIIEDSSKKIYKLIGNLGDEKLLAFASCGYADGSEYIKYWLETGAIPEEYPRGIEVSLIVVTDVNVYTAFGGSEDGVCRLCRGRNREANGSGRDFVYSALTLGMDAVQAVKHACKLDIYSGGKITKLKLR